MTTAIKLDIIRGCRNWGFNNTGFGIAAGPGENSRPPTCNHKEPGFWGVFRTSLPGGRVPFFMTAIINFNIREVACVIVLR